MVEPDPSGQQKPFHEAIERGLPVVRGRAGRAVMEDVARHRLDPDDPLGIDQKVVHGPGQGCDELVLCGHEIVGKRGRAQAPHERQRDQQRRRLVAGQGHRAAG